MTLENPQNILIKMNSIKDNIDYLNKSKNTLIKPIFAQNTLIYPSNNYFSKNHLNDYSKSDISNNNYENLYQNQQNYSTTKTNTISKYNVLNTLSNINSAFNLNEDITFKQINDSLFNLDCLNSNGIKNYFPNNSNKLIKPIYYYLPNNLNNIKNITDEKKLLLENDQVKHKEIFKKNKKIINKFKISRIEIKTKSNNRLKHKRKYKPDDIRKKIKARFHKSIKNIINENLRKAGSKYLFSFLPQIFISSIAREKNHKILNLTYRELLQKDFVSDIDEKKYKNKNVDLSKYKNNLRVLDYLDKNPEICKISGFDIISKMKYSDLLDEYFKSDEFEKAIYKLKEENEEEDYINEYKIKAKGYVKFFSELPLKIKNNKNIIIQDDKDNLNKNSIIAEK